MKLFYIVGEPGIGKSTALALALQGLPDLPQCKPFAWRDRLKLAELGAKREAFSGTDALAMDVQPKVLRWLRKPVRPIIVGEGDRLGNMSFLEGAAKLGYVVTLIHLWAPVDVAAARRATRGTQQDETWIAGRRTKAANLMTGWNGPKVGIKAVESAHCVGLRLREVIGL